MKIIKICCPEILAVVGGCSLCVETTLIGQGFCMGGRLCSYPKFEHLLGAGVEAKRVVMLVRLDLVRNECEVWGLPPAVCGNWLGNY